MTKQADLIKQFYEGFAEKNAAKMIACYHPDVKFEDPAFGKLSSARARGMWEMLMSNKDAVQKFSFDNIQVNGDTGTANWIAEYVFGPNKRKVVNHVKANFKFKDNLIIEHKDEFSMWKWSRQALGLAGTILGWSPIIKNKVQSTANQRLDAYMQAK
ncbi:nuclear transport factor 2 family protein [Putridiphycobacter roseus]|nr:nuclear transport factor 2 family protein [Putridiphycobacter roseus]